MLLLFLKILKPGARQKMPSAGLNWSFLLFASVPLVVPLSPVQLCGGWYNGRNFCQSTWSFNEMGIKVFKFNNYWAIFGKKKRPTVTENIHWNYESRSGAILKGVFLCILRPWVRNCAQNSKGSWIVVWLWRDQFLILSTDFKILCRLNTMHKYSQWKV